MTTFFLVLIHPVKAFRELKTTGRFSIVSFIVILFLMLLNQILMIPVNGKILTLTVGSMSLPENQKEMMIQMAHKFRYLQVASSEMIYIFMFLLYALLLYVFIRIAKKKLVYKHVLQLILYSYFIVAIGDLFNTLLLYVRGLELITNIHDTSLVGLSLFTSVEQVNSTLYIFLSYFTPFQLGFIALLSVGVKTFTDLKYLKSLFIAILFWLITILIPTLSFYYSQLTVDNSGIL